MKDKHLWKRAMGIPIPPNPCYLLGPEQALSQGLAAALGMYQSPQDHLAEQEAAQRAHLATLAARACTADPFWKYHPYASRTYGMGYAARGPFSIGQAIYQSIKEGTLEITVRFEKVDGHHILITAGCEKRVVHNRKELLKAVQELADKHTEALVKELK